MADRKNRDVVPLQSKAAATVKQRIRARSSRRSSKLHSVVIGIDRYRDENIRNLQYACADAIAVANLLERRLAPPERSVHLLVDKQATRDAIMTLIGETLPRVQGSDDLVLIYFAGHGSPEHESPPDMVSRYLVPHGADYGRIFATGIGLERELTALLERQSASRVLLILDACFSGLAGGRTFVGPVLRRTRAIFAPQRISLRSLDLGSGRAMLAACKDEEVSREQDGHGIFTRHLLEALTAPGEPIIPVAELYRLVYAAVVASTKDQQHPVLKGELAGLALPRLCV
jgi:uncharacterized caspase-like protein